MTLDYLEQNHPETKPIPQDWELGISNQKERWYNAQPEPTDAWTCIITKQGGAYEVYVEFGRQNKDFMYYNGLYHKKYGVTETLYNYQKISPE